MTKKQNSIIVSGQQINVVTGDGYKNYICLTDLIKANDADVERTGMILQNWMRRKDTIINLKFVTSSRSGVLKLVMKGETNNRTDYSGTKFSIVKMLL